MEAKKYEIKKFPLDLDLETPKVLKQLAKSYRRLSELKGIASTIPNEEILINSLSLQEARDSSSIENIITTQDEIFTASLNIKEAVVSSSAKEVLRYADALKHGFKSVRKNKILTLNNIIEIQSILTESNSGYRSLPGTKKKNSSTNETVYTPPQSIDEINSLMRNLEVFINDDSISDLDPLVKLCLIHHQFESIHPFYDGNGRTGRIINILYLVLKDCADLPILYLSRYITNNKGEYYRLLQNVRDNGAWEDWILFILRGIEETSEETIFLVKQIVSLMQSTKIKMRECLGKRYSHEFLNNLFFHPYTKVEFIVDALDVNRKTASTYLELLVENGCLEKQKLGKSNFYVNKELYDLLFGFGERIKNMRKNGDKIL